MSYPYMYWYAVHCMLASGPYSKVAVYCVYTCSTILCIYQVTIACMHGRTYIYNWKVNWEPWEYYACLYTWSWVWYIHVLHALEEKCGSSTLLICLYAGLCLYHAGQIDNKCTQMSYHQVTKKQNTPQIEQQRHLVTNIPKINKTGNNKHGTVFINNSH